MIGAFQLSVEESVKDFAVVPATKTPKIPIVYPYGFIIKASVDALHEKPKILGTYAINKKILENRTTGIAEIKPSRMARR